MPVRASIKLAALAALILGGTLAVYAGVLSPYLSLPTLVETAREALSTPALFMAAYLGAALLGFPASLLSVLAGFLFGIFPGILWVMLAANLGAWLGYAIGRGLGEEARLAWTARSPRLARFQQGLSQNALPFVLQVRLLPIVPFALSNYGFAFFGCPFWKFALGTALGLLPGTLAYTYFGQSLRSADISSGAESLGRMNLVVSAALIVALPAISLVVHRFSRRRGKV